MYKHQVVGIRRERSWRSRQSEHIVGLCTLEALDSDGRFVNLDPDKRWRVESGKIVGLGAKAKASLQPRCRYWVLEEIVAAMQQSTPRHEFFTRDPRGRKIPVFQYLGTTDLLTLDADGNEVKVYCDERGHGLHTRDPDGGDNVPFRPSVDRQLFVRVPESRATEKVTRRKGILYVQDAEGNPVEVEERGGDVRWIKTRGDRKTPGNLHALPATPVPCPRANCPIIPDGTEPVFRTDGSDG